MLRVYFGWIRDDCWKIFLSFRRDTTGKPKPVKNTIPPRFAWLFDQGPWIYPSKPYDCDDQWWPSQVWMLISQMFIQGTHCCGAFRCNASDHWSHCAGIVEEDLCGLWQTPWAPIKFHLRWETMALWELNAILECHKACNILQQSWNEYQSNSQPIWIWLVCELNLQPFTAVESVAMFWAVVPLTLKPTPTKHGSNT